MTAFNKYLMFNKNFDIRIHFWLWCRKKWQTEHRCLIEIRSEETLFLLKVRGVIKYNILWLLKYRKLATTLALNWQDAYLRCCLLPWEHSAHIKCYPPCIFCYIFWRCNVLSLSCDLTWLCDQQLMWILWITALYQNTPPCQF